MKATLLHVRRLADMAKLTRAIRYYAKALKKSFTLYAMCIYPNLTVYIYIYTPQQYTYRTISNVFPKTQIFLHLLFSTIIKQSCLRADIYMYIYIYIYIYI